MHNPIKMLLQHYHQWRSKKGARALGRRPCGRTSTLFASI